MYSIKDIELTLENYEPYLKTQLSDIKDKIDELSETRDRLYIAIDGKSGSGKSTLADFLKKIYKCNIFHMDDFFLRPELKTEKRLREVGGNVDYLRFKSEVVDKLLTDTEFDYQIYSCKSMTLTDYIHVRPKKINIVEGVYSLHPTISDIYDFKIFLDIPADIQSFRILERNGSFMHKRFMNEWIPKENEYFEKMKIKEKCNMILVSKN